MPDNTDDNRLKVYVDGKEYALDDFELGELEWLEDELGGLDDENFRSMKAAVRFVYLIKKRDDPDFTLEQARKVKLGSLDAQENGNGNGNGNGRRPTKAAKAAQRTSGRSGAASSTKT